MESVVTLEQAAERLGVRTSSVPRLIARKLIPAAQVVPCAPWQIPVEALDAAAVQKAASKIKSRARVPQTRATVEELLLFSESYEGVQNVA